MNDFSRTLEKSFGAKLTDKEIESLLLKYQTDLWKNGKLEFSGVLSDVEGKLGTVRLGVQDAKKTTPADQINPSLRTEDLFDYIRERLIVKHLNVRTDNPIQKAYILLSDNRSSEMTRAQMKSTLEFRVCIKLTEQQVDGIFDVLDPYRSGTIKVRSFVNAIFKNSKTSTTVNLPERAPKEPIESEYGHEVQFARGTYDKSIVGLHAPDSKNIRPYTTSELETAIRDKIFERSSLETNMAQAIIKYFGDQRDKNELGAITKEQLCFTIWKKFKLRVREEDINKLFEKYDPQGRGQIPMKKFIEVFVTKQNVNEPILEDLMRSSKSAVVKDSLGRSKNMRNFLSFIRRMIRELINRESRAPHALLHGITRMTFEQAKKFFEEKLNTKVDDSILEELAVEFPGGGLIDMKRMLKSAMELDDFGLNGKDVALINGSTVDIDNVPSSLKSIKYSKGQLEELIYRKINERQTNYHPLATLHKTFHEPGQDRVITKAGMRNVLTKYDIILSEPDFDEFFASHDRGDGKVNVREFLQHLMPPVNPSENFFTPKSDEAYRLEKEMAGTIEQLTGRRRQVNQLEGPNFTKITEQDRQNFEMTTTGIFGGRRPQSSGGKTTYNNFGSSGSSSPSTLPSMGASTTLHIDSEAISNAGKMYNSGSRPSTAPIQMQVQNNEFKPSPIKPNSRYSPRLVQEQQQEDRDYLSPSPPSPSPPSPTRPITAPNFRPLKVEESNSPKVSSPRKQVATNLATDTTTGSPRLGGEDSPRVPRAKFTYTGQKPTPGIDPHSEILAAKLGVTRAHRVTSNDDYGLFMKNFTKATKTQQTIQKRFDEDIGKLTLKDKELKKLSQSLGLSPRSTGSPTKSRGNSSPQQGRVMTQMFGEGNGPFKTVMIPQGH